MNILYNIGIGLYALGARIGALRSEKLRKMTAGQKESADRLRQALGEGGCDLWVHAASLGEFEQGRPMIERLRREHPQWRIVLSFFSPSGFEVRKNYPMVDAVVYLPFDTPGRMRPFIEALAPRMAVIVKYEFWGNMLQLLSRRGVPTYLICGIFRPKQAFFRPWGGMMRGMLRCFTHLYVQNDESRRLLAGIGIDNVSVCGDTRLDRVTDIVSQPAPLVAMERFAPDRQRWVVGSSWGADEDVYLPWLNAHEDVCAIIAPHEFDAERLEALRNGVRGRVMLMSEWDSLLTSDPSADVSDVRALIVDSFGKLSTLYRYADVAYVGGGFGAGIHNVPEAAVYGIPVVFGPRYAKFKEAVDLIAAGGAFSVDSADRFCSVADRLYADRTFRTAAGKAAADYIAANTGATDRILQSIFSQK